MNDAAPQLLDAQIATMDLLHLPFGNDCVDDQSGNCQRRERQCKPQGSGGRRRHCTPWFWKHGYGGSRYRSRMLHRSHDNFITRGEAGAGNENWWPVTTDSIPRLARAGSLVGWPEALAKPSGQQASSPAGRSPSSCTPCTVVGTKTEQVHSHRGYFVHVDRRTMLQALPAKSADGLTHDKCKASGSTRVTGDEQHS